MGSLRRIPSCPRGPASLSSVPSSVPSADIKQLYRLAGVDNKPTVFLFNDTQIVDESFLEDINNVLSSGEVPNLYKPDEFVEVRWHRLTTAPSHVCRCSLACPLTVLWPSCRSATLWRTLLGRTTCCRLQTPCSAI